jgi:hypothetical protein
MAMSALPSDLDGTVIGASRIARDISERVRADEEPRRALDTVS